MPRAGAALVPPSALLLAGVVGPAQPSEWVGCKATQRGQEPATVLTGFLWDVREPAFPGTPRWLSQRGALAQSSRTI